MVGRSLTRWEFSYVSPAKRPSREHQKRAEPPEGAIPLEEYCERERRRQNAFNFALVYEVHCLA